MPNPNNNIKDQKPETASSAEKVKVIYNGNVTWVGNIGADEFILVKGEEYELPATDFVKSMIGQNLLIHSSKK